MVDLAEIVRGEGMRYLQTRVVTRDQRKALADISRCRTEALGSVEASCEDCGVEYRLFRSCRNRSCPKCQSEARQKWLDARLQEILPVSYLHVVFSVPAELHEVAWRCPRPFYAAAIRAAGQAIIEVGRSELHAQLGCHTQLQTWGQLMSFHPHVHCVVPCGGFSEDGSRWIAFDPADLPVDALSSRFRALLSKYIDAALRNGAFDPVARSVPVQQLLAAAGDRQWHVYAAPPFGGPEQLFGYLARYTYRVAITNDRIESYKNHQVTFRWRDHKNEEKPCTMDGQEFLRRFLMHVPPRGFVRIRSFGFLGNRNRKQNLERAWQLIGQPATQSAREPFRPRRLCPACSGRDARTYHFAPRPDAAPQVHLPLRAPPTAPVAA